MQLFFSPKQKPDLNHTVTQMLPMQQAQMNKQSNIKEGIKNYWWRWKTIPLKQKIQRKVKVKLNQVNMAIIQNNFWLLMVNIFNVSDTMHFFFYLKQRPEVNHIVTQMSIMRQTQMKNHHMGSFQVLFFHLERKWTVLIHRTLKRLIQVNIFLYSVVFLKLWLTH